VTTPPFGLDAAVDGGDEILASFAGSALISSQATPADFCSAFASSSYSVRGTLPRFLSRVSLIAAGAALAFFLLFAE
jgi:hypothetical protein